MFHRSLPSFFFALLNRSRTDDGGQVVGSFGVNLTNGIRQGAHLSPVHAVEIVQAWTETYPSGHQVTTGFDAANRPKTVGDYVTSAAYAPQGALQQINFQNGVTESISFSTDRLQPYLISVAKGTTGLLSLGYAYCSQATPGTQGSCTTNNGNLLTQKITPPQSSALTQNYAYDALNRLHTYLEGTQSQTFLYDAYGNRAVDPSSYMPQPGLTPTALAQFNALNRWTGASASYDFAGNQTGTQVGTTTRGFSYDAENRMTASVQPSMPAISYSYDGQGRRVIKTVGTTTTVYVYDAQGQVAAEYGPSTDTGRDYLHADHLGSTRLVTDATGAVKHCYDYYPFGEDIAAGTNGRPSCYASGVYPAGPDALSQKFTSKERDAETGLDYFGARYMSSAQGRFTGIDPAFESEILEYPQTWNRYSYVYNNPLRLTDPDGRCPNCVAAGVGALIGGAIEGGIDLYSQLRQNGGDWSQINRGELSGSIAGGAVAGGLAGFTLGGSLVADIAVGGAANVVGGVVNRSIQNAAGDATIDPLGGDEVATDFVAGAAGGAIGHAVATLAADVAHSPIVGPAPRPGRNFRARQAAYNARKQAAQNTAVRGFAVGTAVSTPSAHWIGSAISNGFWNSLNWLISSPPPPSPPSKPSVNSRVCYTDESGKQVCQ